MRRRCAWPISSTNGPKCWPKQWPGDCPGAAWCCCAATPICRRWPCRGCCVRSKPTMCLPPARSTISMASARRCRSERTAKPTWPASTHSVSPIRNAGSSIAPNSRRWPPHGTARALPPPSPHAQTPIAKLGRRWAERFCSTTATSPRAIVPCKDPQPTPTRAIRSHPRRWPACAKSSARHWPKTCRPDWPASTADRSCCTCCMAGAAAPNAGCAISAGVSTTQAIWC